MSSRFGTGFTTGVAAHHTYLTDTADAHNRLVSHPVFRISFRFTLLCYQGRASFLSTWVSFTREWLLVQHWEAFSYVLQAVRSLSSTRLSSSSCFMYPYYSSYSLNLSPKSRWLSQGRSTTPISQIALQNDRSIRLWAYCAESSALLLSLAR